MTENKKIGLEILSEFGLTDNEAKVFLATTKLGTPTVSEVADASEVRREEIYRLLPELERIGLIERLLGKPLRLKTLDPKASITMLVKLEREKARDRIDELSFKSKELLQFLGHREEVDHDGEPDSGFSLVQEKEAIRAELYELISKAEKQIDILFSRKDLIWLISTQGEALQEASKRDVKIRIMSEPTTTRDRIPKILHRQFSEKAEVPLKYLLNPSAFYIVADKAQLILITSGAQHLPSATCLWTNNASFVTMTAGNFESHWNDSVHWKSVDGITLSVSPNEAAEESNVHVHRFLLYRSTETKEKILFSFLKERYDAGYLIVYIESKDNVAQVKDAMQKFGFESNLIDDPKNLRIVEWNNWMLENGKFSIEKAMDVLDEMYFESKDLGFKGLAVAGDMMFFFDNNIVEMLEEYEKQIHNIVEGQLELKCAYDEKSILAQENPLQLYGRLVGFHTALLTEDKYGINRAHRKS
jgi:sugar-specific transcriptional regulator TrmB